MNNQIKSKLHLYNIVKPRGSHQLFSTTLVGLNAAKAQQKKIQIFFKTGLRSSLSKQQTAIRTVNTCKQGAHESFNNSAMSVYIAACADMGEG